MHTHSTDSLRELNGNRSAMRIHLDEQHGPWPSVDWNRIDFAVMRQLHMAAGRHGRSRQEMITHARDIARDAATHAFRGLTATRPAVSAVGWTEQGGSFILSDSGERYVVEVRVDCQAQ